MSVPGHRLDRMFNPKTVVVIGDKAPNYMWLRNFRSFENNGGRLYSVQINPPDIEAIEAMGVTNFKSLAEVPEPIDYALVAVPRQVAPRMLRDLIECRAHGAGFFTSGFAETGEELGIQLQNQLTEMARAANFNLVGPNCLGLNLPKIGLPLSTDVPTGRDGKIGFLSQSGTHGMMFTLLAAAGGLYLSRGVSFGNAIVLDVSDYLEYLTLDDETEIIGMYLEGVKNGRAFFEALKAAGAKKPVVIWKGGQTEAGARAIMSHTGSLAAPQAVWDGLMRQCGVITTESLNATLDVMKLLVHSPRPAGDGLALMAMTGGQSVSIADAFAKTGLRIPRFSDHSYAELKKFFNIVGGSYQNPLDMAGTIMVDQSRLALILKIINEDPHIHSVVMELSARFATRMFKDSQEPLKNMLDAIRQAMDKYGKPFLMVIHPAQEEVFVAGILPKFVERGIPTFPSFERAAAALARFHAYAGRVRGRA